jgi:hypothetical protein
VSPPGIDPRLAGLARAVQQVFDGVHHRAFRGDPAANPRLDVQVVAAALAHDTPAVVLLTPWTCNGLAFPPDAAFPGEVIVAGRRLAARPTALEGLGTFWSVNLIPDVSRLPTQRAAAGLAAGWAEPWALAVTSARRGRPVGD